MSKRAPRAAAAREPVQVYLAPDYRLEVSSRLKADYSNGRSYYPLSGQTVRLPPTPRDRPAAEFLTWHNENVYLG